MPKQFKIMAIVAIGVIGLGALLFFNQPTPEEAEHRKMQGTSEEHNALKADRLVHDFGTISMKNGKVKTIFKVSNPSSESVVMNQLYTTCMCTEAKLIQNGSVEGPFGMPGHGALKRFERALGPNEEAEIEIEYDPNAHGPSGVGPIERSVILEGRDGKLITMNIKANVKP